MLLDVVLLLLSPLLRHIVAPLTLCFSFSLFHLLHCPSHSGRRQSGKVTMEEGKSEFLKALNNATVAKDLIEPLLQLEEALRSTQEEDDGEEGGDKEEEEEEEEHEEDDDDDDDDDDEEEDSSRKKKKKRKKKVAAAVAVEEEVDDEEARAAQSEENQYTAEEWNDVSKTMVPTTTLWPNLKARQNWIQYVIGAQNYHQISLANMALWDHAVRFQRAGENDTKTDYIHWSRTWGL